MKKKFLTAAILTVAAITLVVATVFTTLAFLADSSAVSNTFTVGNVGIDMKESAVDENGEIIEGAAKVDGNSYHLKPNGTYKKDPTIYIETTNENDTMFLYVKSNNMIRNVEAGNVTDKEGNPVPTDKKTMRQQLEANGWVEFIQSGDGVEIIWVYGTRDDNGVITPTPVNCNDTQKRGDGTTGPKGEFRLCEEFTIGNVDNAALNLYGGTTVTFTGFAIQTSTGDPAGNNLVKSSWDNIKETFPVNCSINDPKNPYNGLGGEDAYKPVAKSAQTIN
ncbi:MAG: hypothetical protein J6Q76_00250 [Clostridia bacterium]|nr:hypothetical protein [Clostridia bacterium]